MRRVGLYIHIPFCRIRCSYCSFVIHPWRERLAERYRDALIAEIESFAAALPSPVLAETIYFGGGTPSLVPASHIEAILAACRRAFAVDPGCEITLEANPGTIAREKAESYRRLGVNRVSLGAQSFDDAELASVGRDHTGADVRETLALLASCGISNCNLDLIAGLPGQSAAGWMSNLAAASGLAPAHISVYMIELDAKAPLYHEIARGRAALPEDDAVAEWYLRTLDELEDCGYVQYEISNFARPDLQSRHNLKYWLREPVLGFGVGSHSFDGAARYANVASVDAYLSAVERGQSPVEWRRDLGASEGVEEALFLGLRLRRGVDWRALRAGFSTERASRCDAALEELRAEGLVEPCGAGLRLTRRGMLLSNEVFQVFV